MSDDDRLERREKPGPDASAAEKARWMEDDFWRQVANGLSDEVNDSEDE